MRQWLDSLQPRERMILLIGGIVAILIVFWAFVWSPLTTGTEGLRTSITANERMLTNLYRVGTLTSRDERPVRGAQPLGVIVDQTLQANGLGSVLTGTRPDADGASINISFQDAAFDKLLAWLIALQQTEGIYVEGASINDARQRGFVSGQLLLSRS